MKKIAVVLMAVALMFATGSSVSARDWNDHVKVAPNGEGDMIIFPFYLGMADGWETKLSVTNTHSQYSVVAKVVFRSMVYSEELLDFLIYLTPNDVWTGYVRNSGANTILYSTDDSMLAPNSKFASASNPVNQPLYPVECSASPVNDTNQIGYVEVIESWFCDVSQDIVADPAPPSGVIWSVKPPVTKEYVYQLYHATPEQPPVTTNNVYLGQPVDPANPLAGVHFTDRTVNVLTGQMEFQNPAAGLVASMRAAVFADFNCLEHLNTKEATGIADITKRNTLGELEAAMSGNAYIMSYVNNPTAGNVTAHVFTFPTKVTEFNDDDTDEDFCKYINGHGDSEFWHDDNNVVGVKGYRCASYVGTRYNLTENADSTQNPYSGGEDANSMCHEVQILDSSSYIFNEGFTRYTFDLTGKPDTTRTAFALHDRTGVGAVPPAGYYTGVPALATIVYFKDGGIAMKEGARTDGTVVATVNDVLAHLAAVPSIMYEYQYYNTDITTVPAPATPFAATTVGPTY